MRFFSWSSDYMWSSGLAAPRCRQADERVLDTPTSFVLSLDCRSVVSYLLSLFICVEYKCPACIQLSGYVSLLVWYCIIPLLWLLVIPLPLDKRSMGYSGVKQIIQSILKVNGPNILEGTGFILRILIIKFSVFSYKQLIDIRQKAYRSLDFAVKKETRVVRRLLAGPSRAVAKKLII